MLLRPLPYPEPDRLVMVCETHPDRSSDWCGASPANWADWSRQSRTLESVGLARSWPFGLRREGKTLGVRGGVATPGLFQVFQARPLLGRVFLPQDIEPGRQRVVIVSHEFWVSWLGSAPDALGRRLEIDGEPHEIIGVLPEKFVVPQLETVQVWIPLWPERREARGWRGFLSFGRLHRDTSLEQARAEMETLRTQLARAYPETNAGWGVAVHSLLDRTVRSVRPALWVFQTAVLLVLLIACANVATLFLARASAREREFAVRRALGASQPRLVRQLLLESLVFATLGGGAGVVLAVWTVDLFSALAPGWFPRLEAVRVDGPVLIFAAVLSMLTSLLFGLAPTLHAGGADLHEALREGRSGSERRRGRRICEFLVVSEIALACALLVGAGLLLRSFARLLDWRPGFDRNNLVMVQVFSSPGQYPRVGAVVELYRRCVQELRGLPGVLSAGAGSAGPLFGGDGEQEFYIEGRAVPGAGEKPTVSWYDADPGYFQTLGIPLVRGRWFTEQDISGAPLVAVINETMARRYWPGEDPVGQRAHMVAHRATFEIVGVVADTRPFRPDEPPRPEIFWPFAQAPRWAVYFLVRTGVPPGQIVPAIRARLAELDPEMSLGRVHTMDDLVAAQLVNPRFNLMLLGIFAVLAVAIAVVGVYGLMSFSVAQRTQEICIRMAMGAQQRDIFRLLLRRGMTLALAGLGLGLFGAFALTRFLESLLAGVTPTDVGTFAGTSILLLGVAALACYLPARRATQLDPVAALRHE